MFAVDLRHVFASKVTGGLPDPPETVVLGSDQMTVRIAWIEPPGERLSHALSIKS